MESAAKGKEQEPSPFYLPGRCGERRKAVCNIRAHKRHL
jgi:hypothetical protein